MSQENVEIVRRMWEAFLAGDFQAAMSFCAADIEWDGTNLPDGEVGRGEAVILRHLSRWSAIWHDWTVKVEDILEAEDEQVVVLMRETGFSSNGLELDELHAELYTLRDGKVVRRKGFSDPDEALEAAGLSE